MRKFGQSDSRFLAKGDLKNDGGGYRTVNATIVQVTVDSVGDEEESKYIVHFKSGSKGLVLNKTMEDELIHLCGEPPSSDPVALTEHFQGRRVQLYVDESVRFQGKRVGGLRLRGIPAAQQNDPEPPIQPPVEEPPHPAEAADGDEIPF